MRLGDWPHGCLVCDSQYVLDHVSNPELLLNNNIQYIDYICKINYIAPCYETCGGPGRSRVLSGVSQMSDFVENPKQVSIVVLLKNIYKSALGLSGAATASLLAAVLLPFITIEANLAFSRTSAPITGSIAAGWVAWLTLALYVLATASRKLSALSPYRNILDAVAVLSTIGMLVRAWFFNPARDYANQMGTLMGGMIPKGRTGAPSMIDQYPNIGMMLAVLAIGLLLFSRKRST